MESLTIPCLSKLLLPISSRQDTAIPECPSKTTTKPKICFPRKLDLRNNDSHLNFLCSNGRLVDAIAALDSIAQRGSMVTPNTFICLLQSCIDSNSIDIGRQLHSRIHLVNHTTSFVDTKLVSMYAKCGSIDDARLVFDKTAERNLYMWSAMIGGCSREHRWKEVVNLFYRMIHDGFLPDCFLLPKILQACGHCGDFESGRLIHSLAIRCGMGFDIRVNNSILAVYAKCGQMDFASKIFKNMVKRDRVAWNSMISGHCQKNENEEAQRLLDSMQEEGIEPGLVTWNIMIASYNQLGRCDAAMELIKKMESSGIKGDVFTWTCMISGLAQNNMRNQALDIFRVMLLAGVQPNCVTITSALSACASLKALHKGLEVHSIATKIGSLRDLLVGNSLIDMYSKCGEIESAQRVFDIITNKDVYTWNSMIGGYCQAGYCGKASDLFMKMQSSDVKPNVITWNVIISGYIKNGAEEQAMDLFHKMEMDGNIRRNTASWNSLIAGYVQMRRKAKALEIFRQMQYSCVTPNSVTILSVLPASADLVAAKKVKEIHGCALRRNLSSVIAVANSLIDSYGKSGNIFYSRKIFEGVSSKDIITWNSMAASYALHGFSSATFSLYDQMRTAGLKPNRGTFASIILAHALAGNVDEGKRIFNSITDDYQIVPALEHYLAMITLYGRSGKLKEAMEIIEHMPTEPDSSIWSALLIASRVHRNIGLSVYALERLLELEPNDALVHRLLIQAYDVSGRFDDSSRLRLLEKTDSQNHLAESWIEIKNVVHCFFPGDESKPYLDQLYCWLKSIDLEMSELDPHNEFCIEEETEEIGFVHSEKLALAFALITSPSTSRIVRIMKKLRICGNCHRTAKYISMKYGCEIYIHDSSCLHHFKKGNCSCREYW